VHSRDVFEGLFMLHLTTARMSLISLGAGEWNNDPNFTFLLLRRGGKDCKGMIR